MENTVLIIAALLTSALSAMIGMGGGIILLGLMAILIPDGYIVIALHGMIQLIGNGTRTYVFKNAIKILAIETPDFIQSFVSSPLLTFLCSFSL